MEGFKGITPNISPFLIVKWKGDQMAVFVLEWAPRELRLS